MEIPLCVRFHCSALCERFLLKRPLSVGQLCDAVTDDLTLFDPRELINPAAFQYCYALVSLS